MSLISNYEYIRDWANAKFLKKSDQIEVDLSNYYTKGQLYNKTELESRFSEINSNLSNNYVTKSAFNTIADKVDALPRIFMATCDTAASTSAKAAAVTNGGYSLQKGDIVFVTFSYTNTASSPTLNINQNGAKSIRAIINGTLTTLPNPGAIHADETLQFQYDGTYWVLMNLDTAPGTLSTTSTSSLSTSSSESLRGNISLHKVAKTGAYGDLVGIPSITDSITSGSSALLTSGGAYSALSGKENTSNKVTAISSSSTDTQYPSAKAVYTQIGNIEAVLNQIIQPS